VTRPGGAAEVFLADVFVGRIKTRPDPRAPTMFDADGGPPLPWSWAVETVQLRLAQEGPGSTLPELRTQAFVYPPRHVNRLRYGSNLSLPASSPRHTAFLRELLERYRLSGVVTTNYDTLAERVLRHRPMRRDPEPGCFYGGLTRPQFAHGHLPWDRSDPDMHGRIGSLELTGTIPVFKLHGSLNWERRGQKIALYRDQRLAYRRGGQAAIIPPTAEKQAETWLAAVWEGAELVLASSDRWIVVGYSLPEYDHAIGALLHRAAMSGTPVGIVLHDPHAPTLAAHWSEATALPVEPKPAL